MWLSICLSVYSSCDTRTDVSVFEHRHHPLFTRMFLGPPQTCPIPVWGPRDLPHRVWGLLIPAPSFFGAPETCPIPVWGPLRPAPSVYGVLRPAASLCGAPKTCPIPVWGPRDLCVTCLVLRTRHAREDPAYAFCGPCWNSVVWV